MNVERPRGDSSSGESQELSPVDFDNPPELEDRGFGTEQQMYEDINAVLIQRGLGDINTADINDITAETLGEDPAIAATVQRIVRNWRDGAPEAE